jgi:hypothetical protein
MDEPSLNFYKSPFGSRTSWTMWIKRCVVCYIKKNAPSKHAACNGCYSLIPNMRWRLSKPWPGHEKKIQLRQLHVPQRDAPTTSIMRRWAKIPCDLFLFLRPSSNHVHSCWPNHTRMEHDDKVWYGFRRVQGIVTLLRPITLDSTPSVLKYI